MRKRILVIFALALIAAFLFLLKEVFEGDIILKPYFSAGALNIHYYGLVMALAAACAFYIAIKRASSYGIDMKLAEDLVFWTILGGFLGARLYHVTASFGYYSQNLPEIFKVWHGGLSIYGAILGGLLTLWLYKKLSSKPLTFSLLLDWLAPSLLVGQIIGRFGNLFNYEAFGYPTDLPWGMFVPESFRPQVYEHFSFFHPFFLYEALGNLVILLILLKLFKFKVSGRLFFTYFLLYNVLRFCLEFIRLDSVFINGFRVNAIAALSLAVFSAAWLLYQKKNVKVS